MTNSDPKLIEPPVRLSQSKIWQIQKNYFTKYGNRSLEGRGSLLYIQQHHLLAGSMRSRYVCFIQDHQRLHNQTKQTYHILEVGCVRVSLVFMYLQH